MSKIKILHVTSTRYGIGGVEKLLLDMSDKYDPARFDVSYCNLFCEKDGFGVFPAELRARGLKYIGIKGKRWYHVPLMIYRLASALRQERFDIVHLHMLKATIIGGIVGRYFLDSKIVVTKHYTEALTNHRAFIKRLDRYFTRAADRIVSISNYVRADMIRALIPPDKITVIYNGTDIDSFEKRSGEPAEIPVEIDRGDFLIGTVGSLTERKGQKYLFEAMPNVIERVPNARLIVVGEGPEKADLELLRKELGLEDSIVMLGYRDNVAPLLKSIDIYVHPSIHEPFGIALLEAMAANKPVIATSVDGIPEIVVDGVTGALVTPADPEAIASAICDLHGKPETCESMGAEGRRRVESEFSIDRTVREYAYLYESLA